MHALWNDDAMKGQNGLRSVSWSDDSMFCSVYRNQLAIGLFTLSIAIKIANIDAHVQ